MEQVHCRIGSSENDNTGALVLVWRSLPHRQLRKVPLPLRTRAPQFTAA